MTDEAIVTPVTTTTLPPARDSFYSFGYNNFGQLGLNDIENRTRPTFAGLPVSGNLENLWSDISLGYYHTLAISKSGDLFSFGYNYYGQLGNGEFGIGKNIRKPTLINSGINWTKVSAGAYHSLAIGDGKLYAFGSNAHGSLGVGDTNFRKNITNLNTKYVYEQLQPQSSGKIINNKAILNYKVNDTYVENKLYQLPIGSSVVISLETGYYLAVLNKNRNNLIAYSGVPNDPLTTSIIKNVSGTKHDGEYIFYNGKVSISSFGNYDKASLYYYNIASDEFSYYGNEDILRSQGDSGWSQISAGHYHSLGIKDGYLFAWGNNAFGQLGLGDNIDRYAPELVSQDNTWIAVAAGSYHSLALKNEGGVNTLYAFGKNDHGQLGLNSSLSQINLPAAVNSSFNEISLYNTESLASGSIINVQNNKYVFNFSTGKTYDIDDRYVLSEGSYIISGVPSTHPIAFLNAGKTDLFTYNGQNNAGTKVINGYEYIFYHGNVTVNVYGNFDAISAYSLYHGYAGEEDIFLYDNENAHVVDIDAGIDFSVMRTDLNEVWTCGKNNLGQLGLGDYNIRIKPHKIKDYNWTHAKAGANHVLLLDNSKKMWTFGDNSHGQLGLGDTFGRNEPTVTNALERYDDISAGGNHSVASIFSTAPTTPIITNILNSNDTNDIYDRNLRITWEDVLAEQYGVTDYVVESGVSINGPWVLYQDSLSDNKFIDVSGVTVGTNYFFRVKSKNEEGFSDYSNISSGIPERLIDDLYCSTVLLLHLDTNFNSSSRFVSTYTGVGSPTIPTGDAVFGRSYYDNGSTKQLQYFNSQDFNMPNDLCVEFYLKTSGVTSENLLRSIVQGNNFSTTSANNEGNSFGVFTSGHNIIIAEKQNSTIRTLFTYPIPSNKQSDWNHFAWVRDDLTHKLFFNGVQVSGFNQASVLSYIQNRFNIGGNTTNNNNPIYNSFGLRGWIDEVRITKQSRYTSSFSQDLFKRPFGEVAAENCGAGFGGIPLEFDSAYSWNWEIGQQTYQSGLGPALFTGTSWGGLYTSGVNLNAGDTLGLFDYGNSRISTSYVEIYNNNPTILNSISPYSGIVATGNGTISSPLVASGDYAFTDKIFTITQSGNFTFRANVNNNGELGGVNQLSLIKNGLVLQSGAIANFNKYNVSGVGTVEDPMYVKLGRNFFFNKPRETNRVWIKVKRDGFLDIDTAKFNNTEGWWIHKSKQEPSQHSDYGATVYGNNPYSTSDDTYLIRHTANSLNWITNGFLSLVEPPIVYSWDKYLKTYSVEHVANVNQAHYYGSSQQLYQRYDNIPVKKGEYIICGLQSSSTALPSPPNLCSTSGEIRFRVREANNLLELNFENNFLDKSSFDNKVNKNYSSNYNLSFSNDSAAGNYSLSFPYGLSTNPILNHDSSAVSGFYRFPISVDIPTNYLGIKEKFTIETFFKFNALTPGKNEFHRIFAIERPWDGGSVSNQYYLYGEKRDHINLTLQTSGTSIINGFLAFNFESSDDFLSRSNTFIYGLKQNASVDNISYTINIAPSGLQNISLSEWNHVSLVRYYDNIILFLNGKEVNRSLITRKNLFETAENERLIFKRDVAWGGAYYVDTVPVVSGDILGIDSDFVTTSRVRSFYEGYDYLTKTNLISGINNINTTGVGHENSFITTTGNYGTQSNIFKYNYTGTVTFLVDAPSDRNIRLVKNGSRKTLTTINNDDLEIPPSFDVRNSSLSAGFVDGAKRRIGAPLTIGPINGKIDLFAISADAKYLTNFDASLLPYRNDEYFNYDGRKYKRKDTYIYNVSMRTSSDGLAFGDSFFDSIESENRYTSVLLRTNTSVDKVKFSVASYKPQAKVKFKRTNQEKEYISSAEGILKLITSGTPQINSCMSVKYNPNGYYYVSGEGSNGNITTLQTCVNLDLLRSSGSMYYQDYELDITGTLSAPYDYLNIEIIHDENDIIPTRPSVARNLSATSGYGSVTLNWNAPSNFGGETLTGYAIESSLSGINNKLVTKIPNTKQYEFLDLMQGSGYIFSIAPINVLGNGEFTPEILVYPKAYGGPFAPSDVSIYTTSGAMVVNWKPPTDDGGKTINSYIVSITPSGGITSTLTTSASADRTVVAPLNNNTLYNVQIAATNEIGTGVYSAIISGVVRPKMMLTCGENDFYNGGYTSDGSGILGTGAGDSFLFTAISGFNNSWIDVYMGINNACAINASGQLYAWGDNERSQLGDGTTTNRSVPTLVLNPIGVSGIKWKKAAFGLETLYAISENGLLYGAGYGGYGRLGLNTNEYYTTTRLVQTGTGSMFGKSDWVDIKPGPTCLFALDKAGDIYITGQAGVSANILYNFTKIEIPNDVTQNGYLKWKYINTGSRNAAGFYAWVFFLAIDLYGRLWAMEYYAYQLVFKLVSGISNCKAATGYGDSSTGFTKTLYAINNSGELFGAGWNSFGLLGSGIIVGGSGFEPSQPSYTTLLVKTIGSPPNIIDISATDRGLFSLTNNGEIWCIGYNNDGVFGRGNTNVNAANTSFVKTSGNLFYEKISSSNGSSAITLGY
jgi:alpha-tubulin suppressor-like RCC1 family protein